MSGNGLHAASLAMRDVSQVKDWRTCCTMSVVMIQLIGHSAMAKKFALCRIGERARSGFRPYLSVIEAKSGTARAA